MADKWTSYELVVFFYYGNEMVVHPASKKRSAIWNSALFGLESGREDLSFDEAKKRVREKAKGLTIVVDNELAADLVARALMGRMKGTDGTFGEKLVDEFNAMVSEMTSSSVQIKISPMTEDVKKKTAALIGGIGAKVRGLISVNDSPESIVDEIANKLASSQRVPTPRPTPGGGGGGGQEEDKLKKLIEKAEKWDNALDICIANLGELPRFRVSDGVSKVSSSESTLAKYRVWIITQQGVPPTMGSVAKTLMEWDSEAQTVSAPIDLGESSFLGLELISNKFPDHT